MTNGKRELALTLDEIRQRIVHARDGELWLGLSRDEAEELLSALAAVEQDRDRLRPLIGRLADQLEDLSKAQCWQGPRAFPGCDNGGCTHRRNLIAESRAAIAEHSGTEADSPHASK